MSETTRQRVEAEAERVAAESFPDLIDGSFTTIRTGARRAFISGYIAARTVSREAYVQAARRTGISTYQAREYLRETGLLIEGES